MARINLKDIYHVDNRDPDNPKENPNCFVGVPAGDREAFISEMTEDVAYMYFDFQRKDNAYRRRKYYHNAHYSLDVGDGIENDAVNHAPSSEDVFFENETRDELSAALATLPEPQRRRVEAHFFRGMSKTDIAKAERISEKNVRQAIERGLQKMQEYITNNF